MNIYELDPLIMPLRDTMSYGAIERVVISLQKSLRAKHIGASLIALTGSDQLKKCDNLVLVDNHEQQIESVLTDNTSEFKIIHAHRRTILSTEAFQECRDHMPTVVTFHGPAEKIAEKYEKFKRSNIVFTVLSRSQMDLENYGFKIAARIPNGIDTETYKPKCGSEPEHMTYVGRICPDKNQVEAIKACKATGKKLVIAGPVADFDYFHTDIEPLIDDERVIYLGNITEAEVISLLDRTEALLMPVKWDDPYPLAVLEANSMGVPVLGYARGGLTDQVKDDQNGYLTDNYDDFVESFKAAQSLDRSQIRKRTIEKCDWSIVIKGYIDLFRTLE